MPLSQSQAVATAKSMQDRHNKTRERLDNVRRYWKGTQPLPPVIPESAPAEVRAMARMARVNVCDITVNSLGQSLFVDGFRIGNDESNVEGLWAAWQGNRLDRGQSGVHRAAVAYGESFEVVTPGVPFPLIRGVSPRSMEALYGEDPDWPVYALERTSTQTFRLYDDEYVYYLGEERAANGNLNMILTEARRHGAGVVPVVRFLDEIDLDADDEPVTSVRGRIVASEETPHTAGQVSPLVSLQDQIDLITFNLLVAQHYSAFRQRYAIGWVAESEAQLMKSAASQLWTFDEHPDEMKLGEFEQTNLDGYIKSREASLRHAAALSQTPAHELIGELINMSAEALAAAEAGRDRKVDERKTNLGESHEQKFQLVGRYMGIEVPTDAQVVWRDTSARSFAGVVDGLGKLVQMLGIPPQELWERVPGATQQDVERWRSRAAEGDSMSFLADMLQRQAGLEAA